jgi:paraquat-inducible protein A
MSAPSQPNGHPGISNAAALTLAAAIMLVPANLLPIVATETPGDNRIDTIFSGVAELWRQDLWGIAAIVFMASIVVPVLKIAGLTWLLWSAHRKVPARPRRLTRIYAVLDFIGRWSMLDVFLVTFLSGLIQFNELSTVTPRAGVLAFAAAVILTVLATRALDPRMFWRRDEPVPLSP